MTEEVLFESESNQSRIDVAAYLRTVADKLEQGSSVDFQAGGESVSVDPPETVEFEVKVEREGTELGLELELEWDERSGAGSDGDDLRVR